ncbi:MAG: BON domain-containing protein [Armatimonadetes bacterium]|nr:BON domain-containing protein [Armatimonadota bacterium]
MTRSDDEITGEINATFAASPDIHAIEIRVHTHEGRVRLEGVVENLEEKTLAGEAAIEVSGVKDVQNDLTVSADKSLSDQEIECAAQDTLTNAGLDAIGVRVEAGSAFVMGKVTNEATRKQAMQVVSGVAGIRGVYSELEIAGPPRRMDDIGLGDDVAEALSDDPRLEFLDLDVRAEEGHVVISGYIPDHRQLEIATSIAESVPGVRSVENHMVLQELSR